MRPADIIGDDSKMQDSDNTVAATCLGMLLTDEPWQDFGFSKRPKHGAYSQRFRSTWKVELERRILQEMLAVFTAAYVVSGRVPSGKISNPT
jgi:hypothetical protein